MSQSHPNSYDDVEYLSMPVRETDPHVMALVAALFGVDAPEPRTCDLLDLGCGDGGNLLSLASAYPGIRAVGVDPARAAIQRGREMIERTGIGNIALYDDEADVDLDGTMDYVYAHGVLSWVDPDVCSAVVASAAKAVRPGGLVNFSFRAFPHAYYELPARELAQRAIQAEKARAAARGEELSWRDEMRIARERIQLAATTVGAPPQNQVMRVMANKWANLEDWTLFHDDLSDPLHPKWVTEVAEMAAAEGLTYVGELLPHDLWQCWFSEEFCKKVAAEAGPDAVRRRQLVDELAGLAFHSSLFVKADEAPALEPTFGGREIHVRQYANGTPNGAQQSNEISPRVAKVIRDHHPASVTAAQIAKKSGRAPSQVERDLLKLYTRGLVQLSTVPPPIPAPPGDHPRAMPLVMEQIDQRQNFGSSRFHLPVGLDRSARSAVLRLADGTRDRAALRRDLPAFAAAHGMTEGLDLQLAMLDGTLDEAARDGLLAEPAG